MTDHDKTAGSGAQDADRAYCAHLNVKYDPVHHDNGTASDRWTCVMCGGDFWPQHWFFPAPWNRRAATSDREGQPPKPSWDARNDWTSDREGDENESSVHNPNNFSGATDSLRGPGALDDSRYENLKLIARQYEDQINEIQQICLDAGLEPGEDAKTVVEAVRKLAAPPAGEPFHPPQGGDSFELAPSDILKSRAVGRIAVEITDEFCGGSEAAFDVILAMLTRLVDAVASKQPIPQKLPEAGELAEALSKINHLTIYSRHAEGDGEGAEYVRLDEVRAALKSSGRGT